MAEDWILFLTRTAGIYGGQSGTGTGLSPSSTSFLWEHRAINVSYSFICHQC